MILTRLTIDSHLKLINVHVWFLLNEFHLIVSLVGKTKEMKNKIDTHVNYQFVMGFVFECIL